jgi:hypothetical protein
VVETTVVVETEEDINIFSSYKRCQWKLTPFVWNDTVETHCSASYKTICFTIGNQPVANLTRFISLWILSC